MSRILTQFTISILLTITPHEDREVGGLTYHELLKSKQICSVLLNVSLVPVNFEFVFLFIFYLACLFTTDLPLAVDFVVQQIEDS